MTSGRIVAEMTEPRVEFEVTSDVEIVTGTTHLNFKKGDSVKVPATHAATVQAAAEFLHCPPECLRKAKENKREKP